MAKKGRHRRYVEAREFQRSSTFNLEEFDLDAPDPFALPDTGVEDDDDFESDGDDHYADLAAKYADFDTSSNDGAPSADDAASADGTAAADEGDED